MSNRELQFVLITHTTIYDVNTADEYDKKIRALLSTYLVGKYLRLKIKASGKFSDNSMEYSIFLFEGGLTLLHNYIEFNILLQCLYKLQFKFAIFR